MISRILGFTGVVSMDGASWWCFIYHRRANRTIICYHEPLVNTLTLDHSSFTGVLGISVNLQPRVILRQLPDIVLCIVLTP